LRAVLETARRHGYLGGGPVDEHIVHAEGFAAAFAASAGPSAPDPVSVLDLGSGGGVPGLVLALCWTETTFCLLESGTGRAELLEEAVAVLDLGGRVAVVNARAEEAARDPRLRHAFDLVTARAFGRPAVTAECGAPFLEAGGRLIVSDPPGGGAPCGDSTSAADASCRVTLGSSPRWPAEACGELGLEPSLALDKPFAYQVLSQQRLCPPRYPRRVGQPSKRPLF
jgi:16S rRNA (guanine527-N7)-methyltransferase